MKKIMSALYLFSLIATSIALALPERLKGEESCRRLSSGACANHAAIMVVAETTQGYFGGRQSRADALKAMQKSIATAGSISAKWVVIEILPSKLDRLLTQINKEIGSAYKEKKYLQSVPADDLTSDEKLHLSKLEGEGGVIDAKEAEYRLLQGLKSNVEGTLASAIANNCRGGSEFMEPRCTNVVSNLESQLHRIYQEKYQAEIKRHSIFY